VVVYCDNEAAVAVLNSGYAWEPQIMHLLQSLIFFIKARYQISLTVVHIHRKNNTMAITISRDNLSVFHLQVLPPHPDPTRCPASGGCSWWTNGRTGCRYTRLSCSATEAYSSFCRVNTLEPFPASEMRESL